MRLTLIALAAFALAGAPALAQQHDHGAAACSATDAKLPAGLEKWNGGAAIATATSGEHLPHALLTLGEGYAPSLKKKGEVTFTVEPEKPGGSVSYSGLFAFDVAEAGNYAVALSTPAWIDVLEDGKALEPQSFGHGPECTTIRKKVVFALKPGRHVLQVAGNGAETMKLMVAKAS